MIDINADMPVRVMPRNRRFHEGRFYDFKYKKYLEKFKKLTKSRKTYDFFKAVDIPEDTQDSKHLRFDDNVGIYTSKDGFEMTSWGVCSSISEAVIKDFSSLTQNYIMGLEESNMEKLSKDS